MAGELIVLESARLPAETLVFIFENYEHCENFPGNGFRFSV
jgi:hypothetical protein